MPPSKTKRRQALTRKTTANIRLDAALLEMAQELRGTVLHAATTDAIIGRITGETVRARPSSAEGERAPASLSYPLKK
jgi:hypothetical protein